MTCDSSTQKQGAGGLDANRHGDAATMEVVRPTCRALGAKNVSAGGDHCRQRELQPDHEHQENDAELRKKSGFVARHGQLQAMRPDDHASRQIADDRREPQACKHLTAQTEARMTMSVLLSNASAMTVARREVRWVLA